MGARGDRPLLTRLRLNELSPEEFEDFAADLANEIFAPDRAVRFGAQGHKQDGIDVAVHHDDGLITGSKVQTGEAVRTSQDQEGGGFG